MEYNIKNNTDIQSLYSQYWYIFNDKSISKELAEQMFVEIGDLWIIQSDCFVCVSYDVIKYLYVIPKSRGNGLGTYLLEIIPKRIYSAIATKKSVNIFIRSGYTITKSFKNFFYVNNQSKLSFNN